MAELGHLEAGDGDLVEPGRVVARDLVPDIVALEDPRVEVVEGRQQATQAERVAIEHLEVETVVDDQGVKAAAERVGRTCREVGQLEPGRDALAGCVDHSWPARCEGGHATEQVVGEQARESSGPHRDVSGIASETGVVDHGPQGWEEGERQGTHSGAVTGDGGRSGPSAQPALGQVVIGIGQPLRSECCDMHEAGTDGTRGRRTPCAHRLGVRSEVLDLSPTANSVLIGRSIHHRATHDPPQISPATRAYGHARA